MLRIDCPYCGERDEAEYQFGGELPGKRPGLDVCDSEWSDFLFNRDNMKGRQLERWCHSFGCGQWLRLERDTVSHEILSVSPIDVPLPELHS